MTRDLVSGCALLVFSVVYYLVAATIPLSQLADTVGAQGVPKSYGIALGALSILLIAQSLYKLRTATRAAVDPAEREAARKDLHSGLRAAGILAIGVAYLLILPWLGYIVSIALLIGVSAWYQDRTHIRWLVPTAVIGALAFWLIFVELLQIPEPAGIWPSLL